MNLGAGKARSFSFALDHDAELQRACSVSKLSGAGGDGQERRDRLRTKRSRDAVSNAGRLFFGSTRDEEVAGFVKRLPVIFGLAARLGWNEFEQGGRSCFEGITENTLKLSVKIEYKALMVFCQVIFPIFCIFYPITSEIFSSGGKTE